MFVFKDFTRNVRIHHSDVENDNIVFRLHYRVTFWFLMACCVLVSSKQFIKDHINCITDKYLEHVVDTFCFFKSTFTVASLHNSSMVVNHYAAHPGVGMYTGKEEIVRHGYYQWVPFILFLQALSFYFPRKLWKITDDGRLSKIVQHMRTARLVDSTDRVINNVKIESEESRTKKTRWFSSTYLTISRFRVTRDWARMLVLCEFLNALNLIANWYLTDKFFNGKFSALGSNWWNDRTDYVEEIFPKVTKCTFHKYGSSGSIQNHDTICIMSLNIINEKIYVLLWFWFIVLFIVTAAGLVWRLLTLLLHNRSYAFNKLIWGEVSPGPALNPLDIEILTRRLCFADWMFLYYIGKNIDGKIFRTAVSQVAVELSKYKPNRLLTLENSVDEDPKESDC